MEINMASKVAMTGARSRLVVLLHSFFALPSFHWVAIFVFSHYF